MIRTSAGFGCTADVRRMYLRMPHGHRTGALQMPYRHRTGVRGDVRRGTADTVRIPYRCRTDTVRAYVWLSWKFDGNSRKWKFPEISGNFQPLFGTSTPGVGNSGDITGGWDANHAWATMKRWLNLIIHHLNRAIRAENKIQKQINHANQILNSQQRHCEVCSLCSGGVEIRHTDMQK